MWAICGEKRGTWTSSLSLWIRAIDGAPGSHAQRIATRKHLVRREIDRRFSICHTLFFSMTNHFAFDRARIDSRKAFFHRWREQRDVRNFAKIFGDEPDRLLGRYPVEMIEAGEIHRT